MSMHGLFERLFKIRPEEFRLTQAFFCYYTCIGMLYTLGATVGDSLFLSHVSPARVDGLLAWVYVGIAVATVGATWIFNVVQDRLRRIVLILSTQLMLAGTVMAFRLVLAGWGPGSPWWLYFGLIIWLEVCALLSIMLFYSFAGDYFTTRAAKRLYGYIVGGLALGNVLGGLAVGPLVVLMGTANLLYAVAGLLGAGGPRGAGGPASQPRVRAALVRSQELGADEVPHRRLRRPLRRLPPSSRGPASLAGHGSAFQDGHLSLAPPTVRPALSLLHVARIRNGARKRQLRRPRR